MAWLMCGSFIGSLIGYLISLYDLRSTSPLHAFLLRYPAVPLLALAAATIITIANLLYGARRKAQA